MQTAERSEVGLPARGRAQHTKKNKMMISFEIIRKINYKFHFAFLLIKNKYYNSLLLFSLQKM
jgi:hypothetical protein